MNNSFKHQLDISEEKANELVQAFNNGVAAFKNQVLGILHENKLAAENLTDFDKHRPAQELLIETYEDLIAIIGK